MDHLIHTFTAPPTPSNQKPSRDSIESPQNSPCLNQQHNLTITRPNSLPLSYPPCPLSKLPLTACLPPIHHPSTQPAEPKTTPHTAPPPPLHPPHPPEQKNPTPQAPNSPVLLQLSKRPSNAENQESTVRDPSNETHHGIEGAKNRLGEQ